MRQNKVLSPIFFFFFSFVLTSCGEDEEQLMIAELQGDLAMASATMDSLNYQVDSVNLLLDQARARADSLQRVDDKLLAKVQNLNKEVRKFRKLYTEQQRKNKELAAEIQRLQVEKQADRQTIAQLRSEADSLNTVLLDAHTSIRRQSDHIRRLEMDLAQTQDDLEDLRRAQFEVRVLTAREDFLKENGYLKTSRPFGRGFRKSYKLIKKLNPSDSMVRKIPIGEALVLDGKFATVVDHYGSLSDGKDYQENSDNDAVTLTFTNELLAGMDVLVVMKK